MNEHALTHCIHPLVSLTIYQVCILDRLGIQDFESSSHESNNDNGNMTMNNQPAYTNSRSSTPASAERRPSTPAPPRPLHCHPRCHPGSSSGLRAGSSKPRDFRIQNGFRRFTVLRSGFQGFRGMLQGGQEMMHCTHPAQKQTVVQAHTLRPPNLHPVCLHRPWF